MASTTYYDSHPLLAEHAPQQQQSFPSPNLQSPGYSGYSSGKNTPLKPLVPVGEMENHNHHEHRTSLVNFEGLKKIHEHDAVLKAHIRRFRLISRVIATIISLAVLVPITMTLHKFLKTQHTYEDVRHTNGTIQRRTAWAKDTKEWPTWMYFLVAAISVLFNFGILISYCTAGVEKANKISTAASIFTWGVMLGNLVVWCTAAGLYRSEKDKNGKSNDLWGWTCSPAARAIQKEFTGVVDFNQSCNVQSVSWYIGLIQVGAALLTVFIYILVIMRRSSKKKLTKRNSKNAGYYPTNY